MTQDDEFADPTPNTRWAWIRFGVAALFLGSGPLPWVETRGCGGQSVVRRRTLLDTLVDMETSGLFVILALVVVVIGVTVVVPRLQRYLVSFPLHILGGLAAGSLGWTLFVVATFTLGGSTKLLPAAYVGLGALTVLTLDHLMRIVIDAVVLVRDARGPWPRGKPPLVQDGGDE